MLKGIVQSFTGPCVIACDGKCHKAWGIQCRPAIQLDEIDLDDFCWLSDDEIEGDAPRNPGTSEGGWYKPLSHDQFPNKWCSRQCERSIIVSEKSQITLKDFSKRLYNKPRKTIP